jgi:hypothetical protein
MYMLYVDESGDPLNSGERNFVLAGIAVFERQTYWLSQQLDSLEVEIFGPPPKPGESSPIVRPVEFHAYDIHSRSKPPWKGLPPGKSSETLGRLGRLIGDCHETCATFAVVVDRPSHPGEDLVRFAFDELTRRFDLYLSRRRAVISDNQKGLMILDESRHERRLQDLLRSYTIDGGPFGRLRNFADVPFFADSRASRMLQLADFVAWSTFRRYERGVTNYFDQIVGRFDSEGPRIHGLVHRIRDSSGCFCPICVNRRTLASPL